MFFKILLLVVCIILLALGIRILLKNLIYKNKAIFPANDGNPNKDSTVSTATDSSQTPSTTAGGSPTPTAASEPANPTAASTSPKPGAASASPKPPAASEPGAASGGSEASTAPKPAAVSEPPISSPALEPPKPGEEASHSSGYGYSQSLRRKLRI